MTSDVSEVLLPCPFCNGDDVGVATLRSHFCVQCGCEANGPWRRSPESAITAWNTRAQPAVLAVPGWRPIESAPKDGTVIILGYLPNPRIDRHVYEGKWHELQGWWTSVNGFMVHNDATHWMPLPAAPAIHEGGEHA